MSTLLKGGSDPSLTDWAADAFTIISLQWVSNTKGLESDELCVKIAPFWHYRYSVVLVDSLNYVSSMVSTSAILGRVFFAHFVFHSDLCFIAVILR